MPDASPTQTPPSSEVAAADEYQCGVPPPGWVPYTVQAGDTLFGLLSSNQLLEEVLTVNCMRDTRIHSLHELWIPGASTTVAADDNADASSTDADSAATADTNDDTSADTTAEAATDTTTSAAAPATATTTQATDVYPTTPVWHISSPGQGALVFNDTPIMGTANFDPVVVQFYKVELGIPQLSNDVQWLTIGETHVMPVVNGHLETLFAAGLPPGDYYLRLVVVKDSNYVGEPHTVQIRR